MKKISFNSFMHFRLTMISAILLLFLLPACFSNDKETSVNGNIVATADNDKCKDKDLAILNWRSRCVELLNSKKWCSCFEENYNIKMGADEQCRYFSATVTNSWQNPSVQVKCGTPQNPR